MAESMTSFRAPHGAKSPAICGLLAPLLFAIVVIAFGFLTPGYSHISQAVSELGATGAPYAVIQDINFITTGILTVAFAFGLHRAIGDGRGSRSGPALIGAFGISFIGDGLFPCAVGCKFTTIPGTLHNLFGLTGFVFVLLGILVFSKRLKSDTQLRAYRLYSIATGLFALLFLLLFVWGSATESPLRGLFQRLFVAPVLIWIGAMALKSMSLLAGGRALHGQR